MERRRRRAGADADIPPVRIECQGIVVGSRADKRSLDGAKRGGDGAVDGLIELGVLRAGIRQRQRDHIAAQGRAHDRGVIQRARRDGGGVHRGARGERGDGEGARVERGGAHAAHRYHIRPCEGAVDTTG